ncbi:MAG TPA: hypothetical protein VFU48_14185, partial [Nitrospira sp.]|nr:hypothetical protein [Nitrospira sp.]
TLAKSKRPITAPTSREHITAAAHLLRQWSSQTRAAPDASAGLAPSKLAVLLDHQYTPTGLTRDALKGVDRARADALFAAAREADCDASLALVTYWETGSAEPSGDYGYGYGRHRRYGRYDDDVDDEDGGEHVMGEVFDSSLTAEQFSDAEGNPLAYGRIPLDDDEIVSKQPLSAGKPDKEDFEGYTGNAGMTLDRWYHRAAVMIWPAASRFDVLCEAGVEAAVGGLETMVRQWKQAPKSEQQTFEQPCLEFARRIISQWPERTFASGYYAGYAPVGYDDYDYDDEADDDLGGIEEESAPRKDFTARETSPRRLLSLLAELDDVTLIAAYIRGILARDLSVDPGKTLGDLCKRYGWATFQEDLRELFENTSNETLERHVRLLADWSLRKDRNADRTRLCSQLARLIMSALERCDPKQDRHDWRAKVVNLSTLLPPLTQAFLALEEPELLARLVAYILEGPKQLDLTTVQVPALLSLKRWLKQNVKNPSSALHRWLTTVVEELEFRKAHPPQEPIDWRRQSATGCSCADCLELSRFLEDPNAETLRLPLAEQRRRHLHHIIDGKKLDATHVTERRGRPYTLVCTKTKASYERALKAHHVDLDHLSKMQQLLEWHEALGSLTLRRPGRHITKSRRKRHE